jgi:hypothetical protein
LVQEGVKALAMPLGKPASAAGGSCALAWLEVKGACGTCMGGTGIRMGGSDTLGRWARAADGGKALARFISSRGSLSSLALAGEKALGALASISIGFMATGPIGIMPAGPGGPKGGMLPCPDGSGPSSPDEARAS